MIESVKHFDERGSFTCGCPEGDWQGRLEHKAWGKKGNLMLYFADERTGKRWWLSVWWNKDYGPDGGGINFKENAEVGTLFALTTGITKGGFPKLVRAKALAESCVAQGNIARHNSATAAELVRLMRIVRDSGNQADDFMPALKQMAAIFNRVGPQAVVDTLREVPATKQNKAEVSAIIALATTVAGGGIPNAWPSTHRIVGVA